MKKKIFFAISFWFAFFLLVLTYKSNYNQKDNYIQQP